MSANIAVRTQAASVTLHSQTYSNKNKACCRFTSQKIKVVYDTNPGRFKTLQQILEAEKEMHGDQWPKVGATLALMWLKRFDYLYANCLVYLLHLTSLNYPIPSPPEV